jgi:hypothetical protein
MVKDKVHSKLNKFIQWLLTEEEQQVYNHSNHNSMQEIDFILDRHGHYPVWGYEIYEWWDKNVYKVKENRNE